MRVARQFIQRKGFTLIELLVVVSIIALLISILLPSLKSARESSKVVVCRNNLRSIWTGIIQYSFVNMDNVPFMEDINQTDPNADPFDQDPAHNSTVGRVLQKYVNEKSWICPSAIRGYPANAPRGQWKMTYWFRTAGAIGEGTPYSPSNATEGALGPLVSNYVSFDGRPLRVLSGRRHTPSNPLAPNRDHIGPWTFSFPLIADLINGDESAGRPVYPHSGVVEQRLDLQNARGLFERNTGKGRKKARMELHTEGDKVRIMLTRVPFPHQPGF